MHYEREYKRLQKEAKERELLEQSSEKFTLLEEYADQKQESIDSKLDGRDESHE